MFRLSYRKVQFIFVCSTPKRTEMWAASNTWIICVENWFAFAFHYIYHQHRIDGVLFAFKKMLENLIKTSVQVLIISDLENEPKYHFELPNNTISSIEATKQQ